MLATPPEPRRARIERPSLMDWDKLRIFHEVAAAGSFTRAGDKLNLSQSAVSRQIGALEESLGLTLFHRHARGLLLTEQGELLFDTVHEVFAKLAMAEAGGHEHEPDDEERGPDDGGSGEPAGGLSEHQVHGILLEEGSRPWLRACIIPEPGTLTCPERG